MRDIIRAMLVVILLAATVKAADGFKIIRPADESHKLLPNACEVCHKGQNLKFFLVTASEAKALEEALKLLSTGSRNIILEKAIAASPTAKANPHVMGTCLFCHVTDPATGAEGEEMVLRTLTGTTTAKENQEEVCRLCHPKLNTANHPKLYASEAKAADDLEAAGLELVDGKPVCTTCHDMHDPAAVEFSLKSNVRNYFQSARSAYPHGRKVGCLACHPTVQQAGTTPKFIDDDMVTTCTRCHGEKHDSHRYGMKNDEKTYPMDFLAFPLSKDGRLVCTTCHDEPCTSGPDVRNPKMLRGGPYQAISSMCDKCHPKRGEMALNPHKQIGPNGEVLASACVFCHVADPWDGEYGPGNMAYVDSPSELCVNCHKQSPHPSRDHLIRVKPKILDQMKEYESRHQVKLPLYDDDLITCFTCHNPHGKGVLSGQEALGAGELKSLRIPSFAEICTPCHKRYD